MDFVIIYWSFLAMLSAIKEEFEYPVYLTNYEINEDILNVWKNQATLVPKRDLAASSISNVNHYIYKLSNCRILP